MKTVLLDPGTLTLSGSSGGYRSIFQSIQNIGGKYAYFIFLPGITVVENTPVSFSGSMLSHFSIVNISSILFMIFIFGLIILFIPYFGIMDSNNKKIKNIFNFSVERGTVQLFFFTGIRFIGSVIFWKNAIIFPSRASHIDSFTEFVFITLMIILIVRIVIGLSNSITKNFSIKSMLPSLDNIFFLLPICVFFLLFVIYAKNHHIVNDLVKNIYFIKWLIILIIYLVAFSMVLSSTNYIWTFFQNEKIRNWNWKIRALFCVHFFMLILVPFIIAIIIYYYVDSIDIAISNNFALGYWFPVQVVIVRFVVFMATKLKANRKVDQYYLSTIYIFVVIVCYVAIHVILALFTGDVYVYDLILPIVGSIYMGVYYINKELKEIAIEYKIMQNIGEK